MMTFKPQLDPWYRFDDLMLRAGHKTGGLTANIRLDALRALAAVSIDDQDRARLQQDIDEKMEDLMLLSPETLQEVQVILRDGTGVPQAFVVDRMFGGSLSADPEELSRGLSSRETWPMIGYTSHNVDHPHQGLVLMVMVAIWAQWASDVLVLAS